MIKKLVKLPTVELFDICQKAAQGAKETTFEKMKVKISFKISTS